MKKDTHPQVNTDCVVTCACGNSFTTISTLKAIKVDVCSACHPFYTGQQRFMDTEGRIDKFEKKRKLAKIAKQKAEATKKAREMKKATQKGASKAEPTLKELLKSARESQDK